LQQRKVMKSVTARPATDGAGVSINRLSGFSSMMRMDPFLMLDEIKSDNPDDFIAGFPPHPHRGFETVTYMRKGSFSHKDSMGNEGSISSGGAQWMTAGSGVIHSEMPVAGADAMHGFQFWLNLPARDKMQQPQYLDLEKDDITRVDYQGASIRLIAGELELAGDTITGPVTGKTTQPLLADVELPAQGSLNLAYPDPISSQFYVYQGAVEVAGETVPAGHLAWLGEGQHLTLEAANDSGLLLFGGKPLNEPVAHYGPYVMNTQQEIEQAIRDYQQGKLVRDPVVTLSAVNRDQ